MYTVNNKVNATGSAAQAGRKPRKNNVRSEVHTSDSHSVTCWGPRALHEHAVLLHARRVASLVTSHRLGPCPPACAEE